MISIKIISEYHYYNIHFKEDDFYYSADEDMNYFDMGGGQVEEEGYKNLIRRMNRYFVRKKLCYGGKVV